MRDWLVARCHISRARARTLVDAAAKVKDLPALASALSDGRLTLDVFAPLVTVATSQTDAGLAKAAEHWTPRQARQYVDELKGATDAEAAAQVLRRFVRFDDQRCLIWAQIPGDSYALVKSALVGRARRHDHPSASDPDYERFESRCADALVQICVEQGQAAKPGTGQDGSSPTRTGSNSTPVHGGARTTMIVHTDLDRLLYGDGYGHASIQGVGPISAEVARRLACNAHITLSFDSARRHHSRPEEAGARPQRGPANRDPAPGQRLSLSGLRVPERHRCPSHRLGLEAGTDRHVEPAHPLRRSPQSSP